MRIDFLKKSKLLFIPLLMAALSVNCSKDSGDDAPAETPVDPDNPFGTSADSNTISISGSLNLTGGTSLALLADDSYNLYCVTFTDSPTATAIDIAASGEFSGDLEGFAGKSFGCFFRQGSTTISTVEFEGDSSQVFGPGSLTFDLKYDEATGKVVAVGIEYTGSVDKDQFIAANKTTVPSLTGSWNIGCNDDDTVSGFDCGFFTEGIDVFINEFTNEDGKRVAAIWDTEAKRDLCLGDAGNEFSPNFSVTLGDNSYDLTYDSVANFRASVDAIYGDLTGDLKTAIDKIATERASDQLQWCQYQTTFETSSCKIIEVEHECFFKIDDRGNEIEECHPKWLGGTNFADISAFNGEVKAQSETCYFDPVKAEDNRAPYCPPNATDNGDGTGVLEWYYTEKDDGRWEPLQLFCENAQGDTEQHPLLGSTLADAVTAINNERGGSGGECAETDNTTYAGKKNGEVDVYRNVIHSLFINFEEEGSSEDICSRFSVADDFTFASCETNRDQEVCHMDWIAYDLNMEIVGGKYVAKQNSNVGFFPWHMQQIVCPDVSGPDYSDPNVDHMQAERDAGNACRNAFTSLTAVQQARALMAMMTKWMPTSIRLSCDTSFSESVRTAAKSAAQGSCAADVFYDRMCFEGGHCEVNLRCEGSAEAGRCYNEDGGFIGRLPGRHALMAVKPKVFGSFELLDKSENEWYKFDHENDKPIKCLEIHQTLITGRLASADEFNAIFVSKSKEECESAEETNSSNAETMECPVGMDCTDMEGMEGSEGAGGGEDGGGGKGDEGPWSVKFIRN